MFQDLRHAFRGLVRSPGFAAAAVATLALGIGANTAIFSIVRSVLLRPLPFANPGALVMLRETHPRTGPVGINLTPANFESVRGAARSFEGLECWDLAFLNLTGRGEPLRLRGARVSGGLFGLLGVAPARGRFFREGEANVAVISHGLWSRVFDSDPGIVGRSITLDAKPYSVAAVMPPGFRFPIQPDSPEIWVPLSVTALSSGEMRDARVLKVIGRLRDAPGSVQARAELAAIAGRLRQARPDDNAGMGLLLIPLRERVVGDARPALLLLLGGVGAVLLIACANVASLLLARGVGRRREIATRTALGATRLRLIRQLVTESLALWMVGGVFASVIAVWGVRVFVSIAPPDIPRLEEIRLDAGVLGIALLSSLVTGLLFGVIPAIHMSRWRIQGPLQDAARGATSDRTGGRLRSWLVVSEMALACLLMVGTGLLTGSFLRVRASDPGFDAAGVLTLEVALPDSRYASGESIQAFFAEAREKISAIPGVRAVGGSTHFPYRNRWRNPITAEGREPASADQAPLATISPVTPGYFEAMGIPLRAGRLFTSRDEAVALPAALLDETAARQFFPGQNAVGKRVRLGSGGSDPTWMTVVGVVGTIRENPEARSFPEIYLPFRQLAPRLTPLLGRTMFFAVRSGGDPLALTGSIRGTIRSIDPQQPIAAVALLEDLRADSRAERRFSISLISVFGFSAILLAAIGLYGLVSYSVAQRTREIGIRSALGALRADIVRLVLRQGLVLGLAGAAAGILASYLVTRFLSRLLFEISPTDPITFFGGSAIVLSIALLATYLPARRAARLDPMSALRHE